MVLFLGYQDKISEMLRTCNPGLSSRFNVETAFVFEDYDDAALATIMLSMAKKSGLGLTPAVARAAIANVIAKQRAAPKFGNARNVDNLLRQAMLKAGQRRSSGSSGASVTAGATGSAVAAPPDDNLIEADFFTPAKPGAALAQLDELVNVDAIRARIQREETKLANMRTMLGGIDPKEHLKNWCFVGPPGTGKTTVARVFGRVFQELGLLGTDRVVECKGADLMATHTGQTAPKVTALLESARGGVLFIDEAYTLDFNANPGAGFAKEAVDSLTQGLTDESFKGNLIVILAGYEDQIDSLLRCNIGLPSRFEERLEFIAWTPENCVPQVIKLCEGNRMLVRPCLD